MFKKIGPVQKIENQIAYVGRDSHEKGIDILKEAESEINGNVIYCTDRSWEEAMHIIKSSSIVVVPSRMESLPTTCLLYTSDAADDTPCVDLGGRRIIK